MDPLSLEAIGADALHQGMQLLYARAQELLSSRRRGGDEGQVEPGDTSIDGPALAELGSQIERLTDALEVFRHSPAAAADPSRDQLLIVDALRRCVEAVQHRSFEFPGERRVVADVDVGDVSGYVAGVLAQASPDGSIQASIRAGDVSGTVVGVKLTDPTESHRE